MDYIKIRTIVDLLDTLPERYRNKDVVAAKKNNVWVKYHANTFRHHVDSISLGLLALGIEKGDKVGNISSNNPEWNFIDFAVMQIGAVHVPLYPTLSLHDLVYIINHAEIKLLFVSSRELYEKVLSIQHETPYLKEVYTYEDSIPGSKSLKALEQSGKDQDTEKLKTLHASVHPDDLLTLIYTSGTTGTPKGVMLSHANLVSNVSTCYVLYPSKAKKALSFLPLSHIFERMVVYMHFYRGISVFYADGIDHIAANLQEVQPEIFSVVPRLLEKMYDKIVANGAALKGIKKALFYWALNLGLTYEHDGKNGLWYEIQLSLARKIVFSKWRAVLGGQLGGMVSGGAALQERLARVFWAAGIPIMEGYGLTETSPVIAVNLVNKGAHAFGTVGPIINGVEIKIAEDGEILCKGPNVMQGYYKQPEQTAEAMQGEWFHTGDIGLIVDHHYLKITDRKKEMFKTAGGKYIAPILIENKFKESIFIEQILVMGEGKRFVAALIVPDFIVLKEWCYRHDIPYTKPSEMVKNPLIINRYQREADKYNESFSKWETVKKFFLLPTAWSIETGEMTPKLSFKRNVIMERNKDLINLIYASPLSETIPS